MKTPSKFHASQTLRILRTTALAAFTTALLTAGASAGVIDYGNPGPLSGTTTAIHNYLLGFRVTVTSGGPLIAFGVDLHGSAALGNLGLYAADGSGGAPGTLVAQTGAFNTSSAGAAVIEVAPKAPVTLAAGDYWIMGVYSTDTAIGYATGGPTDVIDYEELAFTGNLPASFGSPISYSGAKLGYYIRVLTLSASIVYQKGDAVPNVPGATFTSLGVPAIAADSNQNVIAFLGKWKSPAGNGAGIISDAEAVAKAGDLVLPGVAIKSLKDPVVNNAAEVAFLATLSGTGITSANDTAVLSTINTDQHLNVIAQEGTQAADAPAGALWRSFTSVATAGEGRLLFLGTMTQGGGGITAANDTGLWCQDFDDTPHLLLQEGTTQIGGKTVKSFVVLKTVSGTPGQTHAFNLAADLVAKVTFTDGAQSVVHITLP